MGYLRETLKILSIISIAAVIVISIFGILAVMDANDFKEKFPEEPNLFLLVEEGDILAGAKNLMHPTEPEPITSEEAAVYQQLLDSSGYDSIVGKNYKVFLVSMDTFDSLAEGEIADSGFTKEDAVEALHNDDLRAWLIDKSLEQAEIPDEYHDRVMQQLEEEIPSEQDIRASMFFLLLGGASQESGPAFIIKEFKNGNIEVYPETMLFRFIKIVPESAVDMIESRIQT
ncbi:hypothetical protein GF345_01075 [Candidatus Woesearchaeota archaeon]|nr:hypothetical protein [Candidatus Woesearchaeota archaeon]